MKFARTRTAAAVAAIAFSAGTALAADPKMPANISWTAYGTTSSG